MQQNQAGGAPVFRSKVIIRNLPPEMTLEEFKEDVEPFLSAVNHLHFIPGKAPAFYPSLSDDSNNEKGVAAKVHTAKGVITFSNSGKKKDSEEAELKPLSPQELLDQKIETEEHYVRVLGGRLSTAFVSFTSPEHLLQFSKEFDGKVFESSRGRSYRASVRLSSLPGAFLKESLSISETYIASLQESPLYLKWREEQKAKDVEKPAPAANLTFDQQTELILEQERQLHPWKYDPDFYKKTPIMTFLAESAQKEAEKEKELELELRRKALKEREKKAAAAKNVTKKKNQSGVVDQSNPKSPAEAQKFKIKPRQKTEPIKKEEAPHQKPEVSKAEESTKEVRPPMKSAIQQPAKEASASVQKPQNPRRLSTSNLSKWDPAPSASEAASVQQKPKERPVRPKSEEKPIQQSSPKPSVEQQPKLAKRFFTTSTKKTSTT